MSSYSNNLRIELITAGTQAGTWGTTTNDNLSTVIDAAIAGNAVVTTTSANEALTYLNGPSTVAAYNTSVRAILILDTTYAGTYNVYAPPVSKLYIIKNASATRSAVIYNSDVIGSTTSTGTGVTIPAGKTMAVWSDGTNFYQQGTYFSSPEIASPSMTGTPTAPTASAGTNTTQVATTAFVGTAVTNATGSLGTMSTQNANNVAITGGAISSVAFGTGNSIQGLLEKATITASAPSGTINFDVLTQSVQYYTSNTTASFSLNIRGNSGTTLNSVMSTGQALTIALIITNGSSAYSAGYYPLIDGSTVTPKWQNGTGSTAYSNSLNAYVYTIIKTASATYTVLASSTKYA